MAGRMEERIQRADWSDSEEGQRRREKGGAGEAKQWKGSWYEAQDGWKEKKKKLKVDKGGW